MVSYVYVGLGGALGAMARVALTSVLPPSAFHMPIKIMIVNILGCFILGTIVEIFALYAHMPQGVQHFLVQGLLGGFTTFSAFALEFGLLFEKNSYVLACSYVVLSVVLSILFFFMGMRIPRIFAPR